VPPPVGEEHSLKNVRSQGYQAAPLTRWSSDPQSLRPGSKTPHNPGKRAAIRHHRSSQGTGKGAFVNRAAGRDVVSAPALRRAPEQEMNEVRSLYFRMDSLLRKLRGSYRWVKDFDESDKRRLCLAQTGLFGQTARRQLRFALSRIG
jgi:hypothetical protein